MENQDQTFLAVAKNAAIKAGEYLRNNFLKSHKGFFKTSKDIGIAEDKESEKIILSIIKNKFTAHNFLSEETGFIDNKSPFTWFIDPLDGTNNYFAGIPYFSVSIALKKNDEIIIGVVYNPISQQLFEAEKDKGSFLNGEKLTPSLINTLEKSVCSFIQGHLVESDIWERNEAEIIKKNLSNKCRRVISTWAPALDWCLLASGGIDGLISYNSEPEDMYAGYIIAKESGIIIDNFEPNSFLAGNKNISKELLNCIEK